MSDLLRSLLLKNMEAKLKMNEDANNLRRHGAVVNKQNEGGDKESVSTEPTEGTASEEGGSGSAEPEVAGKKKKDKKKGSISTNGKSNTSKKYDRLPAPARRSSKRGKYVVQNAENALDNNPSDLDEEAEQEELREQAETDRLWKDFINSLEVERVKKRAGATNKEDTVDGDVTKDQSGKNVAAEEKATMASAKDINDTLKNDEQPKPGTSSAANETAKNSTNGKELAASAPEQRKKCGKSILGNDPKAIGLDQANLDKRGLSGLLEAMKSKPAERTGTLEKSKLDWEEFKRQEGLVAELENHKKSKDTYLEKQEFLERADQRQFEIERNMRASTRSKRSGN